MYFCVSLSLYFFWCTYLHTHAYNHQQQKREKKGEEAEISISFGTHKTNDVFITTLLPSRTHLHTSTHFCSHRQTFTHTLPHSYSPHTNSNLNSNSLLKLTRTPRHRPFCALHVTRNAELFIASIVQTNRHGKLTYDRTRVFTKVSRVFAADLFSCPHPRETCGCWV